MKNYATVAALCLLPTLSLAQTDRELDAHDHGAGSLNIAIEGTSVYIEFEAPWDNLVGFEHAPANDEQTQLVDAALAALQSPNDLFNFVGADCSIDTVNIDNSMEHDDHGHGHSDHDDDTHSAIFAEYIFSCADTASLDAVEVAIFDVWERFEELDVQVIGPKGATSMELTADNSSLSLAAAN